MNPTSQAYRSAFHCWAMRENLSKNIVRDSLARAVPYGLKTIPDWDIKFNQARRAEVHEQRATVPHISK